MKNFPGGIVYKKFYEVGIFSEDRIIRRECYGGGKFYVGEAFYTGTSREGTEFFTEVKPDLKVLFAKR